MLCVFYTQTTILINTGVSPIGRHQHSMQSVCPHVPQPVCMQQHSSQPAVWTPVVAILPSSPQQPLPWRYGDEDGDEDGDG